MFYVGMIFTVHFLFFFFISGHLLLSFLFSSYLGHPAPTSLPVRSFLFRAPHQIQWLWVSSNTSPYKFWRKQVRNHLRRRTVHVDSWPAGGHGLESSGCGSINDPLCLVHSWSLHSLAPAFFINDMLLRRLGTHNSRRTTCFSQIQTTWRVRCIMIV